MMVNISDYFDPKLVLFLDDGSREEVLQQLVDTLDQKKCLKNKEEFYKAILEREQIVTTGIGMGIAIPHARVAGQEKFFIAIAVLKNEVEWGSIDEAPVHLVFMIGGPDDKQTEYLQVLSSLTLALKDDNRRKKLATTKTASEVMELFKGR